MTQPTAWRGIGHLALVTTDMDATVRFYHGLLDAPLVATVGAPEFRHYFFRIGEGQTIAFFEFGDPVAETFTKPAGVADPRAPQFDHVAFGVDDEAALLALQERLRDHGVEVTDVVDHGFVRSIYFTDPNGIALEACWWTVDATADDVTVGDPPLFSDPEPVAAVRELIEHGRVDGAARTTLA